MQHGTEVNGRPIDEIIKESARTQLSPVEAVIQSTESAIEVPTTRGLKGSDTVEAIPTYQLISQMLHRELKKLGENLKRHHDPEQSRRLLEETRALVETSRTQMDLLRKESSLHNAKFETYLHSQVRQLEILASKYEVESKRSKILAFKTDSKPHLELMAEYLGFLFEEGETDASLTEIYDRFEQYLESIGISTKEVKQARSLASKEATKDVKTAAWTILGSAPVTLSATSIVSGFLEKFASATGYNKWMLYGFAVASSVGLAVEPWKRAVARWRKKRDSSLTAALRPVLESTQKEIEKKFLQNN